ncbi:sigma factor-like helix-turn-helix DNA-binding protein [Streptomyces sp. URMC 123]|uniref:sigma factor-like helix-turn-helix DNA-binding protein n=1 Tax=Streptomyces sp. URMC 123 TaxID=3423403 RepID=UPI003F1BFDAA
MEKRRVERGRRRAREFETFVAGAAGRLLHAATLLTGDRREAERLLTAALARTYADWDRLRGEDPYDRARQELAVRFARRAWRYRRPRGGLLDRLTPHERLILVLRLYEGVAEEQTAARLGLPAERVRAVCARSIAALRSRSPRAPDHGPDRDPGHGPKRRPERRPDRGPERGRRPAERTSAAGPAGAGA